MKTKQGFFRTLTTISLVALVFAFSCKKDAGDASPFPGRAWEAVRNESTQDSQQDEVDDMVSTQFNKSDNSGKITDDDERLACAKVTFTPSTEEKLSGTLTIDFDHNANGDANPNGWCPDAHGNVRKGSITVAWEGGRWFQVGSVINVTLTNYSINGMEITGTRVLTNITDNIQKPTWTIFADHTTIWFGSVISNRTVHKTRQWDVAAGTITVTQTAGTESATTGTTLSGINYTVMIPAGLIYNVSCIGTSKEYIPVSGTKLIEFDSKTVTVDCGSGGCDNTFAISLDGHVGQFIVVNDFPIPL